MQDTHSLQYKTSSLSTGDISLALKYNNSPNTRDSNYAKSMDFTTVKLKPGL